MLNKELRSLSKIKILLLEGIAETAVEEFKSWGLTQVVSLSYSPNTQELAKLIKDFHIIGIRSATNLDRKILTTNSHISAIGCFCIGTNQVDINFARSIGVPVFNSPYSNTRSVAEMAIGHIISLMRNLSTKNLEMQSGIWNKTAKHCFEIRGKTLGIVGYGQIGKQLSTMAESLGMRVVYYDVISQLSLSNAKAVNSLNELLSISDVVSLHVPEDKSTKKLIQKQQLQKMKPGSYLINLARGSIVSIPDLAEALTEKHLAGAALDVFPDEPKSKQDKFKNILQKMDNVILTPHIAGSTEEAQKNIGQEVARKLANFTTSGSTQGAVNFPLLNIHAVNDRTRFVHIHHNLPGVLAKINKVFSELRINILGQYLQTEFDIGYAVIDGEKMDDDKRLAVKNKLRLINKTIRAYSIY